MGKKEFFVEPGIESILKNKTRIIKPGSLLNIIEKLRQNQCYILNYPIIPERSPQKIPYTSLEDEGQLWQRFLKRGRCLDFNNNKTTLEEVINNGKRPLDIRRKLFDLLKIDEYEVAAYGYWGIRKNQHRRIHLVDCIKGAKLFAYSERSKDEKEKIVIRKYDLIKNDDGGIGMGADILMEIPSEQMNKEPYDINLRSVPVKNEKDKYAIIFDFDADHVCKFRVSRSSGLYKGREPLLDFHIIAAYLEFAHHELIENKNMIPLEQCPFAIPTQKTVDFYNKLNKNLAIQYNYNGKKVRRALNRAEKEILLWRFVEKYHHDTTFYATQKLQNYKWD
ncbi:MAG: hypothetical protein AABX61_03425 [Nanoarchaeota archaeon]